MINNLEPHIPTLSEWREGAEAYGVYSYLEDLNPNWEEDEALKNEAADLIYSSHQSVVSQYKALLEEIFTPEQIENEDLPTSAISQYDYDELTSSLDNSIEAREMESLDITFNNLTNKA